MDLMGKNISKFEVLADRLDRFFEEFYYTFGEGSNFFRKGQLTYEQKLLIEDGRKLRSDICKFNGEGNLMDSLTTLKRKLKDVSSQACELSDKIDEFTEDY